MIRPRLLLGTVMSLAMSHLAVADTPVASDTAALARAEAAAMSLGGALKARLLEEMGRAGPVGAVSVCVEEAGPIASRVSSETGVRVGRSSLRLRNPANAPPDWVKTWLDAQGERPASGVTGLSEVVDGKARVLKPIAVEAPCLVCHGTPEQIPADVRTKLTALRPDDRATGYALGDLRGAVWAEAPVRR